MARKEVQYAHGLYEALETAQNKEHEVIEQFVKILVKQNDTYLANKIMDEFVAYFNKQQGIIPVMVESARELDESQLEDVKKQLASQMPDKTFEITTQVNPDLIGGIKIRFDDRVFDASVRQKLNMLSV